MSRRQYRPLENNFSHESTKMVLDAFIEFIRYDDYFFSSRLSYEPFIKLKAIIELKGMNRKITAFMFNYDNKPHLIVHPDSDSCYVYEDLGDNMGYVDVANPNSFEQLRDGIMQWWSKNKIKKHNGRRIVDM